MYLNLNNDQNNSNHYIFEQIKAAFATEPNIAATIYGQRKIFQGCYGRRTALFPSKKCGGSIPTESRLELAHAICLERNPCVINYRSQALKIKTSHDKYCYPDFLIQTIDGCYEVHEIKPSIASLALDEYVRFDRLATLLTSIGITFKLIDQSDLPTEQQLQKILYWYQRGHLRSWNHYEISLATRLLEQQNFQHPEQIYMALKYENLAPQIGDYLLFHRVISIPFPTKSYNAEGE